MISNIKAARMLGWTSLAVGAIEICATRWVENEMGVDNHEALIRVYGGREIAAGLAILNQPGIGGGLATALWSRVVGDAMDIATLCAAATTTRRRSNLMNIALIVIAITGLDILIASLVQRDIIQGRTIAEAARQRVTPTPAVPNWINNPSLTSPDSILSGASAETNIPVSVGNG